MTGTFPKSGEVWMVGLPEGGSDRQQTGPALVVSTNGRNQAAADVIVVPIRAADIELHPHVHVFLPAGEGGLQHDSIARCDRVTTLSKACLVQGPLGDAINISYRSTIIRAVSHALGDAWLSN